MARTVSQHKEIRKQNSTEYKTDALALTIRVGAAGATRHVSSAYMNRDTMAGRAKIGCG